MYIYRILLHAVCPHRGDPAGRAADPSFLHARRISHIRRLKGQAVGSYRAREYIAGAPSGYSREPANAPHSQPEIFRHTAEPSSSAGP